MSWCFLSVGNGYPSQRRFAVRRGHDFTNRSSLRLQPVPPPINFLKITFPEERGHESPDMRVRPASPGKELYRLFGVLFAPQHDDP